MSDIGFDVESDRPDASSSEMGLVAFRLGKEMFCIDVLKVREVLRGIEITPVPGSPGFVLGIINLRGKVVTVVDGRTKFGLSRKEIDDMSRILIMEDGDEATGVLVDSVSEILTIDHSKIDPAPDAGHSSTDFISGVTSVNSELLILVDARRLMDGCRVS